MPGITPIEAVNSILENQYNLSIEIVCPKNRKKYNTLLRQTIHAVLYRYSDLRLQDIGFECGRRDHTTVTHSEKAIRMAEELFRDRNVKDEVLKIYHVFEFKYLEMMRTNGCECKRRERSYSYSYKRY